MQIEYEATFINVSKDEVRARLEGAGAVLEKGEFLQKRSVFFLPEGHEINGGWLRVRDEGDRVTMSLKVVNGTRIEDQKETELKIDNFDNGKVLLSAIGAKEKAYQENMRERWSLDGVDVTIDEWPFLEPFVEVEGASEEDVKHVSEKLGFDFGRALFCSVGTIYAAKFGVDEDTINNKTPRIVFDMENPFVRE